MAKLLAMVAGLTGRMLVVPAAQAVEMGAQPAACAPIILTGVSSISPSWASSLMPLWILTKRAPLAIGTRHCSGARQPSCSTTSKPSVRLPSA